ncbi:MAG: glycosyltransferase family 2 protein [Solirubrobacterales bacterium]|nr:glycosyltransferase family 2 protein [Solirubrobacterales bacterium]
MSTHRDVSIVITCFDYGRFLAEAVASALGQDGGSPEVIVVDDGSTDPDTLTALDALPGEAQVLRRANGGPARARNTGAAAATGELLLMLDADDRLAPDALAAMRQPLDADPGLGFAYGRTRCFGAMSGELAFPPYDPYKLLYRSLVSVTSLVRREAFEAVGGFDPDVPGYEDWDFYLSLLEAGWEGRRVDRVTLHYRRHDRSAFTADRADYRRRWRALRAKHAALYARREELARRSEAGALERAVYRGFWGPRPVPARLEQAAYRILLR